MAKINGVDYVIKQIHQNVTSRKRSKSDFKAIVIHYTANYSIGADAEAHYNYWKTYRKSSCDVIIDDHSIWRINDWYKYYTWQIGDGNGKYGYLNNNVIGIEMCVNKDGNFNKTLSNTIAYIRYLHSHGFTKTLIRHYDASRKICPAMFVDLNIKGYNKAYTDFRKKVFAKSSAKKELYEGMPNTKWMYDQGLIKSKNYEEYSKFTVEQIGIVLKRFHGKYCK